MKSQGDGVDTKNKRNDSFLYDDLIWSGPPDVGPILFTLIARIRINFLAAGGNLHDHST